MSAPVTRASGPAYVRRPRLLALLAGALATALACGREPAPTEPDLAKGGAATALSVTPTALAFTLPPGTPAIITARVQFVGLITASTSDPACATVAPASVPATKPPGSSVYVATFTVTPVGVGSCSITVTDKKGGQATVQVQVTEAFSGQIAFESNRDGNFEIYIMNANEENPTRLTNNAALDGHHDFSPDGARIAFESFRDGNAEIYVMDVNGDNQTRLTNNAAEDADPVFSPDGASIAFWSERDGNREIYVINADGTGLPIRLTTNPAIDAAPAFSPDGSIAFVSNRDGNPEIYVMDANGDNQTRRTNDAASDFDPTFSPDGTRIAFVSGRDGNGEIYVMEANGENPIRLTNNEAVEANPTFSPDGAAIAFDSNRDGNFEIYVMNATDGTGLVNVTQNTAIDGFADWE